MSFAEGSYLWLTLGIITLCQVTSSATTTAPVLYAVNFNAEKTVEVDSTVNLTVRIVSNSSLTGDPMWYRINANLPEDSNITNSGDNYTTLIIDKASYSDDGGTYCLNATNQYGTSTICVDLNIYKDIVCYSDNDPVPILSGSVNHTTVEGEMVMYKCSFGDNYSPIDYYIYWELTLEDGNHITVKDYLNYTNFQMKTYQDCPPNNYSCCRFISNLIIHTNLSMNNAIVTCSAIINELTSYSSSELSVVMRPTITVPLTNVRAEEGKIVNINCAAIATTMSDWTLFTWLKNDDTIRSNPNKYNITTEINPDKSNKNSFKSVLTIYDISEEDEGEYTCIVYYDPNVLRKFGINDEFSDKTTATLQVEQGFPLWKTITVSASGVVGLVIIIAIVTSSYCICKQRRKHGDAEPSSRNGPSTLGETSPLLRSPITVDTNDGDYHSVGVPQEETPRPHQEENSDEVDRLLLPADNVLLPSSQPQNSSTLIRNSTLYVDDAPKVDMIVLLLLVQTENNKPPPSENDGWLEDVSGLLERIKPLVQLDDNEQNVIYDRRWQPEHRSLHLYKVIKERNKIIEVSRLLYGIYYANRRSQVAAHGSDNEMTSPSAQHYPQETIHHHHHHHHNFNLHIEVTTATIRQRLEEFVPDTDDFANPLYQHAPDFMRLVDTKTLSPALCKHGLLSSCDMEFLQLQAIIDSEKVSFIYVKLLRRGKEGYEKLLLCLRDSYAMQHTGHTELHHKLSSQQ